MKTQTNKTIKGKVLGISGKGVIKVGITNRVSHPFYEKTVTKKSTVQASVDTDTVTIGKEVNLISIPPMSKTVKWKVIN